MKEMKEGRAGAALVTAVLLSLAGVLLAHGALVLAHAELTASQSARRSLRLDFLSEGAVLAAIEGSGVRSAGVGVVAADSLAGSDGTASWFGRLRRISSEIWLAEGRAEDGPARRAVAVPIWRADPATRVDAIGAVVVTGGTAAINGLSQVRIEGGNGESEAAPPGGCSTDTGDERALLPWRSDVDSSAITLGLLSLDSLITRADVRLLAEGTPAPTARLGVCLENPLNWGDPYGFGTPCRDRLPVVEVGPGVVIAGGVGQALVVASGDITLRDTDFFGAILAEGEVTLEGRSEVTGLIAGRGGVSISTEASVAGSRCWAEAAFRAVPLGNAIPIPPVRWIRLDG